MVEKDNQPEKIANIPTERIQERRNAPSNTPNVLLYLFCMSTTLEHPVVKGGKTYRPTIEDLYDFHRRMTLKLAKHSNKVLVSALVDRKTGKSLPILHYTENGTTKPINAIAYNNKATNEEKERRPKIESLQGKPEAA